MKKIIVCLCLVVFCFSTVCFAAKDKKENKINKTKNKVSEKIKENGAGTMNEVFKFLKKCKTYYLATVEGDQPRVRPFGTIDMFENKLYIQTGKVKNVSKQMAVNPKIEICAFDGQTWIRISAEAENDDRIEAKQHMLNNYPELQKMYKADDGNTQVLYLKNAEAVFYSFTAEPKVIKF